MRSPRRASTIGTSTAPAASAYSVTLVPDDTGIDQSPAGIDSARRRLSSNSPPGTKPRMTGASGTSSFRSTQPITPRSVIIHESNGLPTIEQTPANASSPISGVRQRCGRVSMRAKSPTSGRSMTSSAPSRIAVVPEPGMPGVSIGTIAPVAAPSLADSGAASVPDGGTPGAERYDGPMKLVIGNRNYSSWSLRPWLLIRRAGIDFETVDVPLFTAEGVAALARWTPHGRVPVLHEAELVAHDSLAICERVAELVPDAGFWPDDPAERARARSISAEMHSGFGHVRTTMPMNCRRTVRGFVPDAATRAELDRIDALLADSLGRTGGPWLAGRFGIADAMYAPVASRLRTYGVASSPIVEAWIDALMDTPGMREWYAAAAAEDAVIEVAEVPDAA